MNFIKNCHYKLEQLDIIAISQMGHTMEKQYAMLLASLLQNRPLFQAICPGSLWARDNIWLLSRVQRLTEPAGDRGLLSRLEKPTRTKGGSFILVGAFNQDKTPWPPYPLPSLPPEPFSSLVLAVLGSGEGSSCSFLHHICEDL